MAFYLSILRIFHSHNFLIHVKVTNGQEKRDEIYDTQNDLFMKRTRNSTRIHFIDIINQEGFVVNTKIDYQYSRFSQEHKINPNVINLNRNYKHLAEEIPDNLKIPFYLDIFSKEYYKNVNTKKVIDGRIINKTQRNIDREKIIKDNPRRIIKNYLLDSIITYAPENFRNIRNTYFIDLVNTHKNELLPKNYELETFSLTIPRSLYTREDIYQESENAKSRRIIKYPIYQLNKENINKNINPELLNKMTTNELSNLETKFNRLKTTYYNNININNKNSINNIEKRLINPVKIEKKRKLYRVHKLSFRQYLNNIDQMENISSEKFPNLTFKSNEFNQFKNKYIGNKNIPIDNKINLNSMRNLFSHKKNVQKIQNQRKIEEEKKAGRTEFNRLTQEIKEKKKQNATRREREEEERKEKEEKTTAANSQTLKELLSKNLSGLTKSCQKQVSEIVTSYLKLKKTVYNDFAIKAFVNKICPTYKGKKLTKEILNNKIR